VTRNTAHWIIIILAALGLKAAGPLVRGVAAILFVISVLFILLTGSDGIEWVIKTFGK
jgi:hypothetical protein